MRIWLDPIRMTALNVTASDVRKVLETNNYLVGPGATKGQYVGIDLTTTTDISKTEDFNNLVVRSENGAIVRLADVARAELGAEDYDSTSLYNGKTATYIGVDPTPGANPLTVAERVRAVMPDLKSQMPSDLEVFIPYDASVFIEESIKEVFTTLAEAVLIVLLVIYLSLGSLRAALIPAIAVPLSIVGAAFLMLLLGYSVNLLTLLSMVLAIGLVVDDAIVVVENVHRHIAEGKHAARRRIGRRARVVAADCRDDDDARGGLCAGRLHGWTRRHPVHRVCVLACRGGADFRRGRADALSDAVVARPERQAAGPLRAWRRTLLWLCSPNATTAALSSNLPYWPAFVAFAFLVLLSMFPMYLTSQQELAPNEDQGILFVAARGPETATIDYTQRYTQDVIDVYQTIPEYYESFFILGFGGSPNSAFSGFKIVPMEQRERTQQQIQEELQPKLNGLVGQQVAVFPRPSLPGAGRGLPLQFVVRTPNDYVELDQSVDELLGAAMKSGKFIFLQKSVEFTRPKTELVIDRDRAGILGISMEDIGRELSTLLGGNNVNWFNLEGRSYKVIPQVEDQVSRVSRELLDLYYLRADSGDLVPLSSLVSFAESIEPSERTQFQQLNSLTLQGMASPGVSLGDALGYLNDEAGRVLPQGYTWDYAGVSRQYMQEGQCAGHHAVPGPRS